MPERFDPAESGFHIPPDRLAEALTELDDPAFWSRLTFLLTAAVQRLTPEDLTERTLYCRRTGTHGMSVLDTGEPNVMKIVWAGRTLVFIDRRLFHEDAYFADPRWVDGQLEAPLVTVPESSTQ